MTASLAAELKALADLKADGTLTPEQFERAKEAVLAGDAIPAGPADGPTHHAGEGAAHPPPDW